MANTTPSGELPAEDERREVASERLTIWYPPSVGIKLDRLARITRRTRAEVVRLLIDQAQPEQLGVPA
jgi:hypothetical protein